MLTIQKVQDFKNKAEQFAQEGAEGLKKLQVLLTGLNKEIKEVALLPQTEQVVSVHSAAISCYEYISQIELQAMAEHVSNLPGVGATNTHTNQTKEVEKKMEINIINNYRNNDTNVYEKGMACLINKKPAEGEEAPTVRIVSKEMEIVGRKAFVEALKNAGVHPTAMRAVLRRYDEKADALTINSSELANKTTSIELRNLLANHAIIPNKGKMRQYAIYSASVVQLLLNKKNKAFNLSTVSTISESKILDELTEGEIVRAKYLGSGKGYKLDKKGTRELFDARDVLILSTDISDEEAIALFQAGFKDMRDVEYKKDDLLKSAILNGITVNGNEYVYLMRSPSQERTKKATFIRKRNGEETVALAKRKLGLSPVDYLDIEGDVYKTKSAKRDGLVLSNSLQANEFNALFEGGFKVNTDLPGGMVELKAKKSNFKILYTPDVKAVIEYGEAYLFDGTKALNGLGKSSELIRTEMDKIKKEIEISDGGGYIDFKHLKHFKNIIGYRTSGIQFREYVSKSKGMLNAAPVKKYTGYDMILPESVVKGSFRPLIEDENKGLDFRVVGKVKKAGTQKEFTLAPNQLIAGAGVDFEVSQALALEQAERVANLFVDQEKLMEFLRHESVEELISGAVSSDHEKTLVDTSLATKVHRILYAYPGAIKDVYVRKWLFNTINESMKRFRKGQFEVEGNYKFMTHDPLLFLQIVKHNLNPKNANNQIETITESEAKELGFKYIEPGHIVLVDEEGYKFIEKEVLLARMPLVHPGEIAITTSKIYRHYIHAKMDDSVFADNMIVFSAFDFTAFSMGGGDFDGDTALTVFDERFIKSTKARKEKYNILPVLDITVKLNSKGEFEGEPIEGCPFVEKKEIIVAKEAPGIEQIKDESGNLTESFKVNVEEMTLESEVAIADYQTKLAANSIEGNNIGVYTNRALGLLDGIYHAEYVLENSELTEKQKERVEQEIEDMFNKVGVLRLAQGWDIDKAKHGGAFVQYLDLHFMDNPPVYSSDREFFSDEEGNIYSELSINGNGERLWALLPWIHSNGFEVSVYEPTNVSELKEYKAQGEYSITKSLMTRQMSFNNKVLNDIVLSKFGVEHLFNPETANLLEEIKAIPVNPTVVRLVEGIVDSAIKMYSSKLAELSSSTKHEAAIQKARGLRRGTHEEIADELFSEGYVEVAEEIGNFLFEFTKGKEHIPGLEIAIAKEAYTRIYNPAKLTENKAKSEEAASKGKDPLTVLNAASSGLSFVFNIAFDFMESTLELLGDSDLMKLQQKEYLATAGEAYSNLNVDIVFTREFAEYAYSQQPTPLEHVVAKFVNEDRKLRITKIEKDSSLDDENKEDPTNIDRYVLTLGSRIIAFLYPEANKFFGSLKFYDVNSLRFTNVNLAKGGAVLRINQ